MSEFWLWFIRPLAEILGVLSLIVGLGLVYAAWVVGSHFVRHVKERVKGSKE